MQEEPDIIPLETGKKGKSKKKEKKNKTEKRDADPNKRLYLRFPHKIPELNEIKEMHPLITNVVLPRQKSARFCFLECGSESDAQTVMKALKDNKTNDAKKLFVSLGKKLEDTELKPKFRIQRTGRKNVSV